MDFVVKKCGVILNPPSFVIVYQSQEKLKRKVMPVRNFKPSFNVDFTAIDLKNRHKLDRVPIAKIKKMLR